MIYDHISGFCRLTSCAKVFKSPNLNHIIVSVFLRYYRKITLHVILIFALSLNINFLSVDQAEKKIKYLTRASCKLKQTFAIRLRIYGDFLISKTSGMTPVTFIYNLDWNKQVMFLHQFNCLLFDVCFSHLKNNTDKKNYITKLS